MNKQCGFTLTKLVTLVVIELVTLVVVIGGVFGAGVIVIGAPIMGNQWYSEKGVLEKIKIGNPEIRKVLKSERNILDYSEILTEDESGARHTFYLDSDIFANYEFHRSQDE